MAEKKKKQRGYIGTTIAREDILGVKFVGRVELASNRERNEPKLMTGIFPVDFAAGGGVLLYKINIFWGGDSSEKTTGSLTTAATVTRTCWRCMKPNLLCLCGKKHKEGWVYIIDAEHSFDPDWAEDLGVDLNKVYVAEPTTGEEGVNMLRAAMSVKEIRLIIIDSLASLFPVEAIMKDTEEDIVGKHPKLMNKLNEKVTTAVGPRRSAREPFVIIATNQMRTDLKVMFGDNKTQPGGWAVKHMARIVFKFEKKRFEDKEKSRYQDEEDTMSKAHRIRVKLEKYQTRRLDGFGEYTRIDVPIPHLGLRNGDIDHFREIYKLALQNGVIIETKKGFRYQEAVWPLLAKDKQATKTAPEQHIKTQKELLRRWKRNKDEALAVQYLTIQEALKHRYANVD
jgi:RecA/RadA recombinase